MRGIDFDKVSDDFRRRNPDIFAETHTRLEKRAISEGKGLGGTSTPTNVFPQNSRAKTMSVAKTAERIEKMPKLNKTEMRFFRDILAPMEADGALIIPQPTRFFHLTGGGSYTPDFLLIDGGGVTVYEVKGGYRGAGWEQGYERYKRAAFEWSRPWLAFVMATWQGKLNAWKIETWEN